jgi:hypothetical protein
LEHSGLSLALVLPYRLLVGAPQALALPGQQANRTGGLFACPLSLEETDCYRVDIDRGGVALGGWSRGSV